MWRKIQIQTALAFNVETLRIPKLSASKFLNNYVANERLVYVLKDDFCSLIKMSSFIIKSFVISVLTMKYRTDIIRICKGTA